jgi:hypothetical protein
MEYVSPLRASERYDCEADSLLALGHTCRVARLHQEDAQDFAGRYRNSKSKNEGSLRMKNAILESDLI